MKLRKTVLFLLPFFALLGLAPLLKSPKPIQSAFADSTQIATRGGQSGTLMFVNGSGTYFNDYDLAVYFFNSSESAWSDRVSYRVSGDTLRVMLPYKNGVSKTWTKCIVCQYDKGKTPQYDEWSGRIAQTADIAFGEWQYYANTVNITGWNGTNLTYATSSNYYYGVRGDNHMYLDLSGFTSWEEGNAKFALYFAYPQSGGAEGWSQSNSSGGYYSAFCWKVNGQDNDHLYECIVPGGQNTLWNLVIAVRIQPEATSPNWDQKWNQTGNLTFVLSNHTATMIHISDWNSGYLDAENIIHRDDRLSFFGNYFLDTVQCSGSGASDATTSVMWNKVKDEYVNHLSKTFQGEVWKSKGDVDGTTIQKAMARYDYIVFYKQYAHEDFINRTTSENKTEYSSLVTPIENNIDKQQVWPVAIVAFVIAMGGLSTLLIIKVRKNKRQ